jgi:hypothetical protein
MRTLALFFLAAAVATSARAQETKPAAPGNAESAPAAKPTEVAMLGRKVSLAVPPEWKESAAGGTFALEGWKHAKGWQHPDIRGFAIHLYGIEGQDVAPAALAKAWLAATGKAKVETLVSVGGRNKSLRGLDTEVELSENGALSFYWMRAIALAKDKVLVVLAEVSPIKREELEEVVDTALPILDSVLDPARNDPWRRDPEFTMTRGGLAIRLKAPAGWTYTRDSDGWYAWMGPIDGQSVQLALTGDGIAVNEKGEALKAGEIFSLAVSVLEESAKEDGKLLAKTKVPGHEQATEIVAASNPSEEASGEWSRSRLFLQAGHLVMLTATHPIQEVSALPPEAFQKQVTAVLDSLKIEVAKPK